MGSALYHRAMAFYDADDRDPRVQHKAWDDYSWMLDVYTGDDDRERRIMEWCSSEFGAEGHPLHGVPGAWKRGGATVNGWTWFGFDTEGRMHQFQTVWGGTDQEHDRSPSSTVNLDPSDDKREG